MPARHEIRIDRSKALHQQPSTGHNRWHPDISPIMTVDPNNTVFMETRDALDGTVTSQTEAADLARVEFGRIHPLTGPVYVKGAEPGDVLEVRILEVRPEPFGFTLLMPGFGILREHFPHPFIAKWDIAGGVARSPQIPGVCIPGAPFMGVMGVAPSHELLNRAEARESDLLKRGGVVLPPSPDGAIPSEHPVQPRAYERYHHGKMAVTLTSVISQPVQPPTSQYLSPALSFPLVMLILHRGIARVVVQPSKWLLLLRFSSVS